MLVRQKIDGTMANAFSIGKRGPTIFQGTTNPNVANQVGLNGDLYVQMGATPTLYQFRSTTWVDVTGETFYRTAVTASYNVLLSDFYLGLRIAAPVTITLPSGQFGKKFIFKDELGSASSINTITVRAANGQTIDGAQTAVISTPRTSLTMVYGVEWHVI